MAKYASTAFQDPLIMATANYTTSAGACAPSTFIDPVIFGASILSIQASLIQDHYSSPDFAIAQPIVPNATSTFCNVTVTYTHPGTNDNINVEIWLPSPESWNGLLQTTGGSGYGAGRFGFLYDLMSNTVAQGYVAMSGDAGLQYVPPPHSVPGSVSPEGWALVSKGNLDLRKLRNFGYKTLQDDAIVAKSIIKDYYSRPAAHSYFVGCSQGGLQALSIAQHYPDLYDGIIAGAPPINFPQLAGGMYWPQMYMKTISSFPPPCELDAITAAAVEECDDLDGFNDGIIGDIEGCREKFNVETIVGKEVKCAQLDWKVVKVSKAATRIVEAIWNGMSWSKTGERMWYGYDIGGDLTGQLNATAAMFGGVAMTVNCSKSGDNCVGSPQPLGTSFIRTFLAKDLEYDIGAMTLKEFEGILKNGIQELGSYWGNDNTDLSGFRDAGGKMISFHGLADNVIPSAGPREYYKSVAALLSSPNANPQTDIRDFYRFFDVPGLGHCIDGTAAQPTELLSQLRAWVEKGEAPESSPIQWVDKNGELQKRVICPWPEVMKVDGTCEPKR